MTKFELINGTWFNLSQIKGLTKAQFIAKYKDQRKYHFDNDDTWNKIQAALKELEPKKETK